MKVQLGLLLDRRSSSGARLTNGPLENVLLIAFSSLAHVAAAYIVTYDRRHGSHAVREVVLVIIRMNIVNVFDLFRWNLQR